MGLVRGWRGVRCANDGCMRSMWVSPARHLRREGAPWTARHHTGLTARDPGGVHAEGCPPRPPCRRVRARFYPRLPSPALRPECAWWSPAPMTVPATGRNSHERYTPGNAGAAAAGASGDPAGPATAPCGDARPAAVVRCRASPPGGAAPGRVRLHLQLLVSAGLDHTHPRNLRALRLLPARPPDA